MNTISEHRLSAIFAQAEGLRTRLHVHTYLDGNSPGSKSWYVKYLALHLVILPLKLLTWLLNALHCNL